MDSRDLAIGVIGAGEVGRRLVKEAASRQTNPVLVYDINGSKLAALAEGPEIRLLMPNIRISTNPSEVARRSDVLYLATAPVRYNAKVAVSIAPHAKPGSIIVDESSVKTPLEKALLRCTPRSVGISLRHLMGAPSLPSLRGVTRAVIPTRVVDAEKQQALDNLERAIGLNLVTIESADAHDSITAVVQGETQTWTFAAGDAWARLGYHGPKDVRWPEAREYKNPLDHIKWMLTLRMYYLHLRSPGVYPDIAALNPYVGKRVAHFLRTGQLLDSLIQNGKVKEFTERGMAARENLGMGNIRESEDWVKERVGDYRPEDQTNSQMMVLAQGISWLTWPGGPVKPRELVLFSSPPYRWFMRVVEAAFGSCLEEFIGNAFNNPDVRRQDAVFWNAANGLCRVLMTGIEPVKKAEFYEAVLTQNAEYFGPELLREGFEQSQGLFQKERLGN